jgi:secreted effector protein SseF
MGSDTISNLTYKLLEKMGMNDDRAQYWSKATSALLRLGLTIGTLFAGTVSVPSVLGTAGSVMSTTKLAKLGAGAAGDKILGFNLDNTKKAKEKADNELKQHKDKIKSQLTVEVMSGATSMRTSDMSSKISGLSTKVSGLSDELTSVKQERDDRTREVQDKDEKLHLASEKAKQQEQSHAMLLAAKNAANASLRKDLEKRNQVIDNFQQKLNQLMLSDDVSPDIRQLALLLQ